MKCLLLADNRPDLLATLEPILKHWGYRVLAASNAKQANEFLQQSDLCLLIFGEGILNDPKLRLPIQQNITDKPLLALAQETDTRQTVRPLHRLSIPVDILSLFAFIQRYVEKYPRQNLRLKLRIPGMYKTLQSDYILADVLSLSMRGLFFKAAAKLDVGDRLTIVFPLLGLCKELEVDGKVLYMVTPGNTNNYVQGFGVGFEELTELENGQLKSFIEDRFLNEVSSTKAGVGDFCEKQVRP